MRNNYVNADEATHRLFDSLHFEINPFDDDLKDIPTETELDSLSDSQLSDTDSKDEIQEPPNVSVSYFIENHSVKVMVRNADSTQSTIHTIVHSINVMSLTSTLIDVY